MLNIFYVACFMRGCQFLRFLANLSQHAADIRLIKPQSGGFVTHFVRFHQRRQIARYPI